MSDGHAEILREPVARTALLDYVEVAQNKQVSGYDELVRVVGKDGLQLPLAMSSFILHHSMRTGGNGVAPHLDGVMAPWKLNATTNRAGNPVHVGLYAESTRPPTVWPTASYVLAEMSITDDDIETSTLRVSYNPKSFVYYDLHLLHLSEDEFQQRQATLAQLAPRGDRRLAEAKMPPNQKTLFSGFLRISARLTRQLVEVANQAD